jgi:hypothetical protein
MDIIAAYREVGSYRGAAQICATTPKTVKRVTDRQESGGQVQSRRAPRPRNYDSVGRLVAERVRKTHGRISAKRLLPAARAAGHEGPRGTSAGWSLSRKCCGARTIIVTVARRCGHRVSTW